MLNVKQNKNVLFLEWNWMEIAQNENTYNIILIKFLYFSTILFNSHFASYLLSKEWKIL